MIFLERLEVVEVPMVRIDSLGTNRMVNGQNFGITGVACLIIVVSC